ncbi:MAG: radical SAM protein [Treponema sp.]|jgi:radical SAM superfamily enzyme YgiQ (UPF0313 family)|nr:radical SAM protein [Treponema sp.]
MGMTFELLKEEQNTILSWRTELCTLSPSLAENFLREHLVLNDCTDIRVLGGFDSRIVCFWDAEKKDIAVISISKPLKETAFYQIYGNVLEESSNYIGRVKNDAGFLPNLSVGLISLAKPEVYTFPRFALGISDIAHALRNQFRSDVFLYDLQLMSKNEILANLKNKKIDLIGISMTFGLFDIMKSMIDDILVIFPGIRIVIGGSLAAIEYNEILGLYPKTIVSLGEGEKCMVQIIEWVMRERELSDISDIAYFDKSGKLIKTIHEPITQAMNLPDFDLLITTLHKEGVFQLETSRGCYNACSFCPRQHKGFWKPLVDNIEALDQFLALYHDYLITNNLNVADQTIYIVDEEFIGKECRENRKRTEQICALFKKYSVRFEISFRMDAIFSAKSTKKENTERIHHVKKIHDYGLNRVLVGVESGVDSVLERFNKHICSIENTQGIRLLTALGVPARFTYITFDPLMTFDELVSTYLYQGRRDLIIDSQKAKEITRLFENSISDEGWEEISKDIPFYYYIPYMLVSLECLIGSKYYTDLEKLKMLEISTIKSLGKKNTRYSDYRIGILSHLSQLWVDRNFSLDYTLKSFGKIYPTAKSNEIRAIRTRIKENSYRLLGKLIYLCTHDLSIIANQPEVEIHFMRMCADVSINKGETGNENEEVLRILNFQFDVLKDDIDQVNPRLAAVLSKNDYTTYQKYYNLWKSSYQWQLINYE